MRISPAASFPSRFDPDLVELAARLEQLLAEASALEQLGRASELALVLSTHAPAGYIAELASRLLTAIHLAAAVPDHLEGCRLMSRTVRVALCSFASPSVAGHA